MENTYSAASSFDTFIERAFKNDYKEYQSINGTFRILIETERGEGFTTSAGSYDKQLQRIKRILEKAIKKYLKLKHSAEESEELIHMLKDLPSLYTISEIKTLLEKGLVITDRFK